MPTQLAKKQSVSRGVAARPRKGRAKPGTKGEGDFYRIEVRRSSDFEIFRNQDVGRKGGIQRLAGKRASGSWDTVSWLIGKNQAHQEGSSLVADTIQARNVIEKLGSAPKWVKGDVFKAKDRPDVPESEKPTPAQKRARQKNIAKAQAARRK